MDLCRCYLATALVCLTNAPWMAASANPAPTTTHRVVELAMPGTLNLASFYRSKLRSDTTYDSAWGIKLSSFVPIDGLETSIDYALTATTGTEQGFLAKRNHFVVLKLARQWHDVKYGLRYFSVGDAFVRDPLGRDLVAQTGLTGVGSGNDGTEVWATLQLSVIKLRPTAKRTTREFAGAQRTDNQLGLIAERTLYGNTRIFYRYNSLSSVFQRGTENPGNPNRHIAQVSVRLSHPAWQIEWKSEQADFSIDHSSLREESLLQFSGTFHLSEDLTFLPSISRRESQDLKLGVSEHAWASIKLGYVATAPSLPDLTLSIRYDQSEGQQVSRKGLQAKLGFKKTLHFPHVHQARTFVGASLTYRRSDDGFSGNTDNALGFQVTFEHSVGG